MRLGLPARHVHADFADDGLGDADVDAVDAGQVDAADAVQFTAEVELGRVAAGLPSPLGRRCGGGRGGSPSGRVGHLVGDALQMLFERLVAFGDPLLVGVVHRDFLLQDKHEVGLPRPLEALGNGLPGGVNAGVAQGREGVRIALTGEDGAHDALPGPAAQIADDIRQLDVHLGQHLLHALDAGADRVDMVAALTPVGAHDANVGGRMKRVAEQAVGVELQQPLALLHVALAAGEILGVPRVDQIDLQAARLQDLVQRNPIDARGLHRHGGHPTLHQPVRQAMQDRR